MMSEVSSNFAIARYNFLSKTIIYSCIHSTLRGLLIRFYLQDIFNGDLSLHTL